MELLRGKLGRPRIGKHAMTAAARPRRHRRGLSGAKPAAKPVASHAADDLPQLLTDAQLEYWANELDTNLDQLDQLASLIGRQMLSLFENDPRKPRAGCCASLDGWASTMAQRRSARSWWRRLTTSPSRNEFF